MNIFDLIKLLAVVLAVTVICYFIYKVWHEKLHEKLNKLDQIKIACIGFIANLLDTAGIGSYALIVALRRIFNVMPDDVKLIGTMNIQASVVTFVQMLIFLHYIDVDLTTMLVSIVMITLGGFVSAFVAVRIRKELVHKIMLYAFIFTGILLLLIQLNFIEFSSESHAITGIKLFFFGIFMLLAGMLPAFGVGYYSLVQSCILFFGASPIIAFPIMALACSYQVPVTAMTFVHTKKFYAKSAVLLAIAGLLGVFIAAPLISHVDSHTLKWILLVVVIYNVITLAKIKKA